VEVSEFTFVVLDDPLMAALSIGGLGLLALGAILAGPRHQPRPGRWAALLGLIVVGCAVVYGLVLAWLTQFTEPV
jgi:hypothetical protein